jgi:hypothetical protein
VVAAADDETTVSQPPDPLWVRCVRFEPADSKEVPEIRCDPASGSQMWCLRRNALGYGLYEVGVEDNCELQALSEELSEALRVTTLAGLSESTEGVSTTWKLMSAADTVSSFMTDLFGSSKPEENVNVMSSKERADSVFERRQREQLVSATKLLNKALARLPEVHIQSSKDLPTDVQRRLEKLCKLLPQAEHGNLQAPEDVLKLTSEVCTRIEKSGSFAAQHRQDFIATSQRLATELEGHIRSLKLKRGVNEVSLLDTRSGGYAGKSSNQPIGVPMLAPPPPPKAGVASAQLIF